MSREILAPPCQRLGSGRCYRVNLVHEDFGGHPAKRQPQQSTKQGYMEQDLYAEDDDDAGEDEGAFTIEELPNSMFKLTMHVAQPFYGGLVGFKGSTKRRIESETQTDIYVPRGRENGGSKAEDVAIKGKSRSNVCAARRKINLLIASLRKRMKPTHFICVPLHTGEIKENFIEFRQQFFKENFNNIHEAEQLFMKEFNIHLTLSVCVLLDDVERDKAVEILQNCRPLITDLKTPFEIKVSGLEIMNDDPSAVRVIYACVDAPDLQQFANRALPLFQASGLGKVERDNVKLHMTVMNSRYRKRLNAQAEDSFDGREVLKRFANFNFGTTQCSEVLLCAIGSSENEFYKTTGSLKF